MILILRETLKVSWFGDKKTLAPQSNLHTLDTEALRILGPSQYSLVSQATGSQAEGTTTVCSVAHQHTGN